MLDNAFTLPELTGGMTNVPVDGSSSNISGQHQTYAEGRSARGHKINFATHIIRLCCIDPGCCTVKFRIPSNTTRVACSCLRCLCPWIRGLLDCPIQLKACRRPLALRAKWASAYFGTVKIASRTGP